jgi:hypothetical protein
MKPKPTSPWEAIDAIMNQNPEPTGPEWFTISQYTKRYAMSRPGAEARLIRDPRFERWVGISREQKRKLVKYRIKPTP